MKVLVSRSQPGRARSIPARITLSGSSWSILAIALAKAALAASLALLSG